MSVLYHGKFLKNRHLTDEHQPSLSGFIKMPLKAFVELWAFDASGQLTNRGNTSQMTDAQLKAKPYAHKVDLVTTGCLSRSETCKTLNDPYLVGELEFNDFMWLVKAYLIKNGFNITAQPIRH